MKIIQNFLPEKYFNKIEKEIKDNKIFPFYFNSTVSSREEKQSLDHFYFTHMVYQHHVPQSAIYEMFLPLLDVLDIKSLIRIKINMYTKTGSLIHHKSHTDYKFTHKGLILSLNDCNGGTQIGETFVKSIRNQALLFDPSVPHNSTNCTDKQARFNININYF